MKLLLTTINSECKCTDLALKYLYCVVADSPIDVQLKTYDKNDLYMDIYEDIATGQYNIVYFHANRYNEAQLKHVAEMVKKAVPSIAIIFGGLQVSFETRRFMKENLFVDYVIRGEGEKVLFSFLKSLLDYEFDFENIAGLAFRDNDQVVVNPYDAPIDMESLPFPYEKFEAGSGTVY
ncbi:MAG: cobalamin-dependent protein, partial [Mogibacterium sp.]|nr:cobalamin-dependent protein [Mogibacterium sp.]